ncbi:NAD(+)/NADH kinase [Athalassotoga sp.]|uniref:NAD(+)/NADH kinase n=1 Tax=Athalassotoga sp. TaxID=2022597 RepID=UPI003D08D45A
MKNFHGAVILKNEKNFDAIKASEILKEKIKGKIEIFDTENAPDNSLFFILGGDGTVLRYAKKIAQKTPFVVGINFGHLGFLSPYEFSEIDRIVKDILTDENFTIVKRKFSKARSRFGEIEFLNEFIVQRDIHSHMIDANIKIDNSEVGSILCDGILISTPTGSTAYNLSAGGSLIDPQANVLSIVPMMAHTLFKTPIVVSSKRKIEIEVNPRDSEKYFTISDGDVLGDQNKTESFEIESSENSVNFLCTKERNFFKIVNQKLGWGIRNGSGKRYD